MELRHTKPLRATRPSGRSVMRPVKGTAKTTKEVAFAIDKPAAQNVLLAGTFNEWIPERTPLRKDAQGKWTTTLSLAPGRYEYRFVADGQWLSDPTAKESVPNDFGSANSVIAV
ncbi:MAG TPA: isoamylase early set domain-containing protein [Verrucomicrobiae bacterium]|nr:isoamylase early set domain-containing protein [Verrucomicrobiae bacterium]